MKATGVIVVIIFKVGVCWVQPGLKIQISLLSSIRILGFILPRVALLLATIFHKLIR
jgi:hypothetical protein